MEASLSRTEIADVTDIENGASGPPLIAVIDDNTLILKMLRYYLPSVGYRAVTWARATGAAAMIEREQPALVVLDIRMEHERAGMDVLRALRERPDEEQVALGYSANDETAVPSDDEEDWWLPDEADMTGPHPSWEHSSGAWCPPAE